MRDSFGISTEYAEYVYEQIFLLNQKMNLSIFDAEEIPVGLRKHYVDKILKAVKDAQK